MPALGQTLVVGTCKTASIHYSTIQAAISAAPTYATVLVCPGTYPEQVVITKPLTLKGAATQPLNMPIVVPPAAGLKIGKIQPVTGSGQINAMIAVDTYGASGTVDIQGLTVDASTSCGSGLDESQDLVGILYVSTNGSVSNSAVRNRGVCAGTAIWIESDTSSTITTNVKNNVVAGFPKSMGITASAGPSATDFDFLIAGNVVSVVQYPLMLNTNGANGLVSDNTIEPVEGMGIVVNDGSTVSRNNVVVNGDSNGIEVYGNGSTITANAVNINGSGFGIGIPSGVKTTVTANRVAGALSAPFATGSHSAGIENGSTAATVQSNVIVNLGYGITACGGSVPRANTIANTTYGIVGTAAAGTVNTFTGVTTPLTACP